MEEFKTERIKFVEVAKGIYAAITPACGLDITDAGMMDNFSNSAYINRGEGLVCDTFFDLPHARELKDFCVRKSGHAPKYVINTHGHWDHFWGNQVFDGATIIGHKDMVKDCADDQKKVGVFRFLYRSNALRVKDYSQYNWTLFDGAAKKEYHDATFPAYLRKAFDMGQELLKSRPRRT